MSTTAPVISDPAESVLVDGVADWLMSCALDESSVEAIFEGCCQRLVAADIPIARANLGFRTLHPLFRSVSQVWRRDQGLEVQTHPHGELTDEFRAGPHYHLVTAGIPMLRRRLEGDSVSIDFPILANLRADAMTDYVAWMIPFGTRGGEFTQQDGVIGSWATSRLGGFTDGDLRTLRRIQRRLAVACKVTIKEQIARNILAAYLGEHAGGRVYAGEIARGSGESIHAVIWFSDLRDSTRLSGEMPVEQFLATLNDFFECIAGPVLERGGEVLRFIGDAVLAIFPMQGHDAADPTCCPVHRATCETALAAARDAIARIDSLNARRAAGREAALRFGIGLHVGDVMYGNIGVPSRVEFTVIGAAANHAAKIEATSKTLGVPLVVSAEFAGILPGNWASLGRHALPGVAVEQEISTLPECAGAANAGALAAR